MIIIKRTIHLITFLLVITFESFSQSDSINVVFRGIGNGEKFSFYHDGKLVKKFKLTGQFVDALFRIAKKEKYESGDPLNSFVVTRRGRYGLSNHDTQIQIRYEDKQFLVIEKNPYLKKKIAVLYYWTNERPATRKIKDILNPK